jgi:hypothetical protein
MPTTPAQSDYANAVTAARDAIDADLSTYASALTDPNAAAAIVACVNTAVSAALTSLGNVAGS